MSWELNRVGPLGSVPDRILSLVLHEAVAGRIHLLGRGTLSVDEVSSLIGSYRGAHLAWNHAQRAFGRFFAEARLRFVIDVAIVPVAVCRSLVVLVAASALFALAVFGADFLCRPCLGRASRETALRSAAAFFW